MRTTPALALVAAFLASSAVSALTLPQAGLEQTQVHLHRRTCHKAESYKKRHHQHDDGAAAPQPWNAPAGDSAAPQPMALSAGGDTSAPQPDTSAADASAPVPQPAASAAGGDATTPPPAAAQPWTIATGADDSQPKKMHKKKGKCALKSKGLGQDTSTTPPQAGGNQSTGLPPVTGVPGADQGADGSQDAPVDAGADTSKGGLPSGNNGADLVTNPEDYSNGDQFGANPGGASPRGDEGVGDQNAPAQPGSGAQGSGGTAPGGFSGKSWGAEGPDGYAGDDQSGAGKDGSADESSEQDGKGASQDKLGDQDQDQDTDGSDGGSTGDEINSAQGKGVLCKGTRGSTTLPRNGKVKPNWFSPDLIHHGPGTQFGDAGLWDGGACMFDGMPHHNLPSVAMDQSFFQDGLACGTCVEIGSTSASLFSNAAHWTVETPKKGTLPAGKKTVAIVSDLCPGVDQCFSGLDMHLDAWNSVTNNAGGSKLPINWRFVNCKEAFEKNNSGVKHMQIHWRNGTTPGFFEVQIRGNHEAVVRVEMKWAHKGWSEATLKDSTWWQWVLPYNDQQNLKDTTAISFRLTDWQGETITSDKTTTMGTDLFFQTNFDRVADLEQQA
ncbi:hypothetical protein EX895_001974 [Sporisorium graminicola]|uniref:Expansin-like EG45 domain-containing protein n=1 Tax=Sporisorium graminicola TaxID=280036 RepID=A0A4U7KXM1_9BASI|nr:hypothetical protein EX895_001974 [Sporisorium graminicola]TKY89443.1 hypothetical protein EX895_001974 [Sporisorium graminicola]